MKTKGVLHTSIFWTLIFLGIIVLTSFTSYRAANYLESDVKVKMLFYIQKTVESYAVIYELNQDNDGNVNDSKPISAYWLKLENNSGRKNLTFIQRKYAYGIESKVIDKKRNIYSFHFVSYKKRELFLLKPQNEKEFRVYTQINGHLAILQKIHVQIVGGTFFNPGVKYVLLKGVLPSTNEIINEKITP